MLRRMPFVYAGHGNWISFWNAQHAASRLDNAFPAAPERNHQRVHETPFRLDETRSFAPMDS